MRSMLFGAACSPCSALYIMRVNAEYHSEDLPSGAKAALENHYMDDYLQSFENEQVAIHTTDELKQLHARGGFNLRAFRSNSEQVRQHYADDESSRTPTMDLNSKKVCEKVLGLRWNTKDDVFFFEFRFDRVAEAVVTGRRPPTKREWLSIVMSVFDPFGFLANITILAKIILQSTWNLQLD